MFPLKTNIPVTRFAYGVWLIILINIVIYIYFRINFHGLLFADHGFLPLKLSMPSEIVSISEKMSSFFTYMFLHSSFLHTAVNMYFLYIFGKNVEEYKCHFDIAVGIRELNEKFLVLETKTKKGGAV